MKAGVVLVLVVAALAGCLDAEHDVPAGLPAPVTSPAWLSCDHAGFEPSAAHGSWMERHPLNIAHQGGENEVPSATMYAFKTALRKGADMLELDVHVTSDGELVVLHDTTVDRTTDGSGAVETLTLAEVQALDAAYWFVPGRNAVHDALASDYLLRGIRTGAKDPPPGCTPEDFRIPTLREVLTEFPDVMMNIEIKNGPPQGAGYERALADLLSEFGRGDDTIVASFIDSWTETFRAYDMEVSTATGTAETGLAKGGSLALAPGVPSLMHEAFQVPIEFEGVPVVDADFVADAHAHGMVVHVWTIDDPATMRWLLDIGVDGIMTAEPTVLEQVLQERGTLWA
ncbi:MAG TPA: glycerophosphodiester phosphodiesterase [Candidatus Thermoplasmatota archaeon]|nr:glycerophosphodiester phosphodiesterase [Candidatus Thermoplasmatota archaeon]